MGLQPGIFASGFGWHSHSWLCVFKSRQGRNTLAQGETAILNARLSSTSTPAVKNIARVGPVGALGPQPGDPNPVSGRTLLPQAIASSPRTSTYRMSFAAPTKSSFRALTKLRWAARRSRQHHR